MVIFVNLLTCIFETIIFDAFFKDSMRRKQKSMLIIISFYLSTIILISSINLFCNSKLNLIANIIIYFLLLLILFDGGVKDKTFYYIIFYTAFAGSEIIFEFLLSLFLGEEYSWIQQKDLLKFIIICLEKLLTFISLFFIKKKLSKEEYGLNNRLILSALILPITTFWIYSVLFYSGLMLKISRINEVGLVIGCVSLLFSNAIIFLLYDHIFRLNKEKQELEMISLKTNMEKKYYDRMEKVNIEQSHYMHDIRFLLKTIGDLAVQGQEEEIATVIRDMAIRLGELEDDFFCRNKVLNTILCEKKREAKDENILYNANVEPGISFDFIRDIDIIIIIGNLVDNAIDASRKVKEGFVDINIFENQKGHFLVIKVENKFDGVINRYGENFYSSKKDNTDKHGIGIKNARNCIEKYGGFLQICYNENLFTATAVFTII